MKARILTGVIGGPIAIAVLAFFPAWAISIVMAAICALATYELLVVSGYLKHKGLLTAAMTFAVLAPFLMLFKRYVGHFAVLYAVLLYMVVLCFIQITHHGRLRVEGTGFVFFVSVITVLSISAIAYMRVLQHGRYFMFFTFVIAWLCDIGAYFMGTLFGKHKLCPQISPKKTVEGFVGGILVSVACSLACAFVYEYFFLIPAGLHICYWQVAAMALVLAPVSVMGDLFCSIIKRQCDVKDFGNIFPGHGGIMDRFDSLIFVAPVVYLICVKIPPIY